jgi:hypothetical protein
VAAWGAACGEPVDWDRAGWLDPRNASRPKASHRRDIGAPLVKFSDALAGPPVPNYGKIRNI